MLDATLVDGSGHPRAPIVPDITQLVVDADHALDPLGEGRHQPRQALGLDLSLEKNHAPPDVDGYRPGWDSEGSRQQHLVDLAPDRLVRAQEHLQEVGPGHYPDQAT